MAHEKNEKNQKNEWCRSTQFYGRSFVCSQYFLSEESLAHKLSSVLSYFVRMWWINLYFRRATRAENAMARNCKLKSSSSSLLSQLFLPFFLFAVCRRQVFWFFVVKYGTRFYLRRQASQGPSWAGRRAGMWWHGCKQARQHRLTPPLVWVVG